jgi:hypothetical protein
MCYLVLQNFFTGCEQHQQESSSSSTCDRGSYLLAAAQLPLYWSKAVEMLHVQQWQHLPIRSAAAGRAKQLGHSR